MSRVHLLAMLGTTVPGPDYTDPDTDVMFQALHYVGLDLPHMAGEELDFGRVHAFLREIDHPLAGLDERSLAALPEILGRQTAMLREAVRPCGRHRPAVLHREAQPSE
ncbi:hypothetical protein ABZU86_06975 [Streptomyces sp. NPDC005271]|uniref:hypothetical protein n=1 Tax=unclassified Streptomyces TaxID=2593676 RepID=UPI0033A5041C